MEDLEKNFRSLGRAIVIRAILDYQKARTDLRAARKAGRKRKVKSCKATIAECTEFFMDPLCKVYSNIDGREILAVINKVKLPERSGELERLIFDDPREDYDYGYAVINLLKEMR